MKNMLTDAVIAELNHLQMHLECAEDAQKDLELEGCECTEPEFCPDENQWEPAHICSRCQEDPIWNGKASELLVNQKEDDLPF